MARIPTYEIDSSISDLDMLIGTDYDNQEYTKNFTLGSIAEYVLDKFIDPDAVQSCIPVFRNISDTQGGNATRITSSIINQNIYPSGTNISISGTLDVEQKVIIKGGAGQSGILQLNCFQNSHGIKIQGPPHSAAASYTMILPDNMGTAGKQLTTDGVDKVYWADAEDDNLDIEGNTGDGTVDLDVEPLIVKGDDTYISTDASANEIAITLDDSDLIKGSGVAGKLAYFTSQDEIADTPNINFSGNATLTLGDGLNVPGHIELLQYSPKITLGDGFTITHALNGPALIKEVGSDDLHIESDNEVEIRSGIGGMGGDTFARFTNDGPIELYYDGVKKFNTNQDGITIIGKAKSDSTIASDVAATLTTKDYVDAGSFPANGITGSGIVGLDAIFSSGTAIASTSYFDATTLPYSSGYVPAAQTTFVNLNDVGGVARPAKVPKEVAWQLYDGGGNTQGAMFLNQQAKLTVGLNGTGNGGQVVVNPQGVGNVNSTDRLAIGGESKFNGRINVMGGGICISPNPTGVVLDNTSLVIGSGDNDIVSGSDHSMAVGKGNQLLKTTGGTGSDHSAAIGQGNILTDAKNSLAVGKSNTINAGGLDGQPDGIRSQVIGLDNTLIDTFASFIAGGQNTVGVADGDNGQNAFVLGYNNQIAGNGDNIFTIGNVIDVNVEESESNLYFFGSNLSLDNASWPTPSGGNLNDAMVIGIRNDESPSYTPDSGTGLGSPALIVGSGHVNQGRNTGLIVTKKISGSNPGSRIIMEDVVGFDFADDTAAGAAGIPVGGLYHTSGVIKIRLT